MRCPEQWAEWIKTGLLQDLHFVTGLCALMGNATLDRSIEQAARKLLYEFLDLDSWQCSATVPTTSTNSEEKTKQGDKKSKEKEESSQTASKKSKSRKRDGKRKQKRSTISNLKRVSQTCADYVLDSGSDTLLHGFATGDSASVNPSPPPGFENVHQAANFTNHESSSISTENSALASDTSLMFENQSQSSGSLKYIYSSVDCYQNFSLNDIEVEHFPLLLSNGQFLPLNSYPFEAARTRGVTHVHLQVLEEEN